MNRKLFISFCLCVAVMLVGCRSRSPKVVTVPLADVSDNIVKLHRTVSGDGVPVNMDYQHPRKFDEEELRREVDLLDVMEHKWGKYGMGSNWLGKPAFTEATKEKLVPALVAAFEKASRSDKILFDVPGRGGRPTRGEVYLKDDKLVWIFKEIDGMTFLGDLPYRLDSKDWRIEEKVGMTVRKDERAQIVRVERDLGVEAAEITPEVARERVYEPVKAVPKEVPEVPEEAVSRGVEELDKKLETLKEWKDKGLITEEDYAKEKARILEQLQQL